MNKNIKNNSSAIVDDVFATGNNNNENNLFAQLLAAGVGSPVQPVRGQILQGEYVGQGLVSYGGKCDAILHPMDRKDGEPARGSKFSCIVTTLGEDEEGVSRDFEPQIVVSIAQAKDWLAAKEALENATRVNVNIVGHQIRRGGTKSGLKVRFGNLTGFIPRSHLTNGREADELIGQDLQLNVMAAESTERKLVFDLRAVREEREAARLQQLAERINTFAVGSFVTGTVKKGIECGFLVDLGDGLCGLVHNTETIRGARPEVGQEIGVVVIGKDEARGRISLSQRKAQRRAFAAANKAGLEVKGAVVAKQQYGLFIEIAPGVTGMLHRSRFDATAAAANVGTELTVRIESIDESGERIDLSL